MTTNPAPLRPPFFVRWWRRLTNLLALIVLIPVIYLAAGFGLGTITRTGSTKDKGGIDVWIVSNGMHTSVVLPATGASFIPNASRTRSGRSVTTAPTCSRPHAESIPETERFFAATFTPNRSSSPAATRSGYPPCIGGAAALPDAFAPVEILSPSVTIRIVSPRRSRARNPPNCSSGAAATFGPAQSSAPSYAATLCKS